ncbi:4Fe-4S dicluster domain-containing protein [Spirosoma sp. BT702]|uniref:4Fe-4S dicluster domain-containing protein n=1 Tax=Spirosoma profusum TaxID=2771354 RepID=A0A927GA42_9BACT|nr:4Fe-4S dicluster domain-containing protein [Spirosoma profusum]MBD2705113.1 4Fe-4S dicluster domain-containing protein [Spirosoma profusum]
MSYFKDIQSGIRTTVKGLSLTLKHLRNATKRRSPEGISSDTYFDQQNGLVTLQYPHEQLPIPDNGRYRLRNEIDDCIVCDKCAKVCPVDCITIDAIKATEEVGRASDGSPIRLYAGKFDIDMAKCCYCGLCTVVCPTECLTMDKKFDYSEFELGKLTYQFSNLTTEQADKKRSLYEQFLREKEEAKRQSAAAKAPADRSANVDSNQSAPVDKPTARPVFRPTARPATTASDKKSENSEGSAVEHPLTDATPDEMERIAQGGIESTKRPVFRPTQKPKTDVPKSPVEANPTETPSVDSAAETPETEAPKPKAAPFRPTMKPGAAKPTTDVTPADSKTDTEPNATSSSPTPAPKPGGFRPTMKPAIMETSQPAEDVTPVSKPAFRPTMKPAKPVELPTDELKADTTNIPVAAEPPKPKPAFRPTMKPVAAVPAKPAETEQEKQSDVTDKLSSAETPVTEPVKPKPAFRPTMKPATAAPKPAEDVTPELSPNDATFQAEAPTAEPPKPKPAFRPTMKPKPKADENQ